MTRKTNLAKKTVAAAMALTMLAGVGTAAIASAKSNDHEKGKKDRKIVIQFKDVSDRDMDWAYEHIIRLSAKGIFNGYEDGSFKPRNSISRVEAIVAAVRLLGLEEEAKKPENMNAKLNFRDFDKLARKYPNAVGYVAVALENDLFNENDTEIQPEKAASRLWASVLLVKAMKLEAEAKAKMDTDLPFKDADRIPAGSVGYVAVAVEKKIVAGYTNNTFLPNKPVTRAELASILDRVDGQLPDEDDAQAITGTITAIANGSITIKKTDNTTVTAALDANVFVFRNNAKVAASALVVGDEALVRTYEGKAVFIEVTKVAVPVVQLVDAGKISTFTLNAEGKVATISLTKDVNGVPQTVIYNVDANVTITGGGGVLAPNLNVIVKGENTIVKTIEITL